MRLITRPAPWLQLSKLSGLPLPRTVYDHALHHHLAVGAGEFLRPADCTHVVVEILRTFPEVRQVAVGQVSIVAHRVFAGQFDEARPDGVADPA